jgi:hypothetical protein
MIVGWLLIVFFSSLLLLVTMLGSFKARYAFSQKAKNLLQFFQKFYTPYHSSRFLNRY